MKILFVSSDSIPHIGGKSTHIMDLVDGLNENGVDSKIISFSSLKTFKKSLIRIFLAPIRLFFVDLYILYYKRIWGFELNRIVRSYCKKNKVDCISVQDAWSAFSIRKTLANTKLPAVLTMHTYFGIENNLDKKNNDRNQIIYKKLLKFELKSLEYIDSIITVDQRILSHVKKTIEDYKRNIGNDLTKVCNNVISIPNFTNINSFKYVNFNDKVKAKTEFGLSADKFVIACARRLVEKNGVINIVKAMKNFNDDVLLLIAGDGPQIKNIKKEMEGHKNNNIMLLGSQSNSDIVRLLSLSDVSVVPSITVNGLQEATSISAIESMSSGIPTIASNIGGLTQLIDNFESGILVEENKPEELFDAINLLKNNKDLYNKISIKSRKEVESKYSHINAAKKYLEQFEYVKQMKK